MCRRVTLLGANNVMFCYCEQCFCLFSAHFKVDLFGLMLERWINYHISGAAFSPFPYLFVAIIGYIIIL